MANPTPFYDNFFVRRPIVAMVIAIVTVIVGVVSLLGLSIEQYPDISPPMVSTFAPSERDPDPTSDRASASLCINCRIGLVVISNQA